MSGWYVWLHLRAMGGLNQWCRPNETLICGLFLKKLPSYLGFGGFWTIWNTCSHYTLPETDCKSCLWKSKLGRWQDDSWLHFLLVRGLLSYFQGRTVSFREGTLAKPWNRPGVSTLQGFAPWIWSWEFACSPHERLSTFCLEIISHTRFHVYAPFLLKPNLTQAVWDDDFLDSAMEIPGTHELFGRSSFWGKWQTNWS